MKIGQDKIKEHTITSMRQEAVEDAEPPEDNSEAAVPSSTKPEEGSL